MNKDIQMLCNYLDEVLIHPLTNKKVEIEDKDLRVLYKRINQFTHILNENYQATEEIASGNFDYKMSKDNLYGSPIKELQSVLKHLTWQINSVSDGNLDMHIHFLGEFSKAFNRMINQLKEKQKTTLENIKLNEELNNQQMQLLERELLNQTNQYMQLVESMEELRRFRHDMKNHFMCIDSLLLDENISGAQDYIHSITNIVANSFNLETNNNYIFNALIDEKIKIASEMETQIKKVVMINRKLQLSEVDVCILFGNALDNCLESLKKVEKGKRKLSLTVILIGDTLSVEITNTMKGDIVIKDNKIQTTKNEKQHHGIGIKNIYATVEKYNGEVHIETNQNQFKLVFILCNV